MIIRKLFVISAIYILSVNCCFAQAQDFTFSEEGSITIGTTLSFQSEILSEERKILVSLPDDYLTSSRRYPVIYILDAQYFHQFQYTSGVISALSYIEKIPKIILVGVHSENRNQDMTTSASNNEGNANNFIEFFRNELQVFIEQQYRTEPYKILIGHSAGGLFALHTLVHAPDTFNAYIAISPSVWWEDGKLLDELKNVLDAGKEFNNNLFTTWANESGRSRKYYDDFLEVIGEYMPDGLGFSNMYFPDESHASTPMRGIYHGILSMYEDWPPPDSINSLDSLILHYQNLSEHYGYSLNIPVSHASDVGFRLINNGDAMGALEVFEYSLNVIAQSAIAYYQVGFALRRLGRLTEALTAFEKAIEIGPESHMLVYFIQNRDEVTQEINEQEEIIE